MRGFLEIQTGGGGGGAVTSVNGQTGDVDIAKADVGLGNVDNTSDVNKPVSTATQMALDGKAASGHTHWNTQVLGGTPNRLWGAGPEGGSSVEYRLLPPVKFNENFLAVEIASQAEAEAGTATDKLMTPLRTAQAITALAGGGGGGGGGDGVPVGASLLYRLVGTGPAFTNLPPGYVAWGDVSTYYSIGPVGSGATYEGDQYHDLYILLFTVANGEGTEATAQDYWDALQPWTLGDIPSFTAVFGYPCQIVKYAA